MSGLPKKGEVFRHPRLRGQWTVKSCGPSWIILTPSIPYLPQQRISTPGFMAANWERCDGLTPMKGEKRALEA